MSDCSRCKIGGNSRCDNKGYYKIAENPDFNYWGWASTCQVNSFGLALAPYANQAELTGVPYGYCGKKLTNTKQCSSIGLPECPGSTERIYVKTRKDTDYSKERLINCCLDIYEDKYLERGYCHPEWCKNNITNRFLPFDFFIPEFNIIIECDGRQHFENISNWKDYQETQKTDFYKMLCALDNNCSIIRIFQEDVFYDKLDWKNILIENIKKYDKPKIIYISKDIEFYDKYKENFIIHNGHT